MRIVGVALLVIFAALPAAAQTTDAPIAPSVTAKPATTTKFRKPAVRPAPLRARAAIGRNAGQSAETASGEQRAATARKRLPTAALGPAPTPRAESTMSAAERLSVQFDLAWTGDYNGLVNGESPERTTAAIK